MQEVKIIKMVMICILCQKFYVQVLLKFGYHFKTRYYFLHIIH